MKQSTLTLLFFILAILFRLYFSLWLDPNLDELHFWGYIQSPDSKSILWSNYPPGGLLVLKVANFFGLNSFLWFRIFIFIITTLSTIVFYLSIRQKKNAPLALFLWAVSAASLNATTAIGISCLVELYACIGLYGFSTNDQNDRNSPLKIQLLSALLIMLTTYSFPVYLGLLVLNYITRTSYSRLLLWLTITAVFTFLSFRLIGWNSLSWLNSESLSESIKFGFVFSRNLFNYSWVMMAFALASTLIVGSRKNTKMILYIFSIPILTNILFGLKAIEPRFFIFFVPFLLVILTDSISELRHRYLFRVSVLILVFVNLKMTAWFMITNRSGLTEAIDWIKSNEIKNVYLYKLSPITQFFFNEKSVSPKFELMPKVCSNCITLSTKPIPNESFESPNYKSGAFGTKSLEPIFFIYTGK